MEAIKFLDPPPCRRDSRSTLAVTVSPPQLDWFFFQLTLLLTPGCFQVLQLGNCVSTCSYSKPPPSVKTLRHTKDLSCTRHLSSWSCPTPLPPPPPRFCMTPAMFVMFLLGSCSNLGRLFFCLPQPTMAKQYPRGPTCSLFECRSQSN